MPLLLHALLNGKAQRNIIAADLRKRIGISVFAFQWRAERKEIISEIPVFITHAKNSSGIKFFNILVVCLGSKILIDNAFIKFFVEFLIVCFRSIRDVVVYHLGIFHFLVGIYDNALIIWRSVKHHRRQHKTEILPALAKTCIRDNLRTVRHFRMFFRILFEQLEILVKRLYLGITICFKNSYLDPESLTNMCCLGFLSIITV